jgi:hypothetical protein
MKRSNLVLPVLTALFAFLLSDYAASAQTTKVIYFLAGPKDHGPPSRHETEKDLLVLQRCMDSVSNVKGVKVVTKFLYKRTALDINDLKDAAALIIESSSETASKERTHPLFPPNTSPKNNTYDKATLAYLKQVDSLHKAGMGIMVIHWGVVTDNQRARDYYISWFGESSMPEYTQNPLGYWSVTPIESGKKHPIMRGVGPFYYKDEIFSRLVVAPGDPYRTDLLMGEAVKTNQGSIAPRGIASAYENGAARGILWGGMDYHSALLNENYLRFMLNAITWTAGIEVPKGGVKTAAKGLQLIPARNDMFDNMK